LAGFITTMSGFRFSVHTTAHRFISDLKTWLDYPISHGAELRNAIAAMAAKVSQWGWKRLVFLGRKFNLLGNAACNINSLGENPTIYR